MAKVLFVNPVVREEDDPRHVPYGMALLAALAVRNGHQVQVYDANAWRASDAILRQVLAADRWDVVAVGGIWAFADPALEERGDVDKHVLRLGPRNARIVQAKARELREALGLPAAR